MAPRSAEAMHAKPVLFVTGHAPAYRLGAFARLHELENVEFALFGGRSKHGGELPEGDLPFPHRRVSERELGALAGAGAHRAVVCSTAGRLAPLGSWAGARRAHVPLILWGSLWAHPQTIAHAFSYLPLRRLYRSADAIVTYGPHVSAYVGARGARNVHVAPQSVDNEFWSSPQARAPAGEWWPREASVRVLFVGRPAREKGLEVLLEAWRERTRIAPGGALVLAGVGARPPGWIAASAAAEGVLCTDALAPEALRDVYEGCEMLVLPSLATRTFREPWGLVINEAMNRGLPVVASDAVGAAAGGLVRERQNGLVVPAGDAGALGAAIRELAGDARMRERLGAAGALDVRAYSHEAWAEGFSGALASVGASSRA
ncbi:MAG TPA: glycosyltransferase family 4 protein [Solirubrobacteraceae bacterium]|jgi:glycosyltransferase involved in cell wall biosynthesis|nr:glycosyltransferase family 4 protein [Solirubrobacteraceae bacterium]